MLLPGGSCGVQCRECPRYDLVAERCLDRKVNPQSWETAVTVAQVMGLRSICTFNDYRERLVAARRPLDPGMSRLVTPE